MRPWRPARASASSRLTRSTVPSRGPGNGILRAETGGLFQAQNAGEQSEFGSQTTLRLTNPPELRGFLSTRKPPRFVGTSHQTFRDHRDMEAVVEDQRQRRSAHGATKPTRTYAELSRLSR